MGVDLATYRARIGCFCNPAHGSLRCWAEASCLLVWLVMSQLMLKLAGDVEENPGPKERKASKGNEGQQRQWSPDVQETGANAGGGYCGTREGWRWMKFSPTGIVREDTDGDHSSVRRAP
ncbi:uncharacterized protein [Branchiostoma lanceolatum]|uniref:uncharacterized protein isoform X3 n=1 Tax=Branchiostoma lanceolatum TaxID=7740 RepID=UPI003455C367